MRGLPTCTVAGVRRRAHDDRIPLRGKGQQIPPHHTHAHTNRDSPRNPTPHHTHTRTHTHRPVRGFGRRNCDWTKRSKGSMDSSGEADCCSVAPCWATSAARWLWVCMCVSASVRVCVRVCVYAVHRNPSLPTLPLSHKSSVMHTHPPTPTHTHPPTHPLTHTHTYVHTYKHTPSSTWLRPLHSTRPQCTDTVNTNTPSSSMSQSSSVVSVSSANRWAVTSRRHMSCSSRTLLSENS